jgi:hypothetical protein
VVTGRAQREVHNAQHFCLNGQKLAGLAGNPDTSRLHQPWQGHERLFIVGSVNSFRSAIRYNADNVRRDMRQRRRRRSEPNCWESMSDTPKLSCTFGS